jgi:hypothetical protein
MDTTNSQSMLGLPYANATPILGSDVGLISGGDDMGKKRAATQAPEPPLKGTQPNAITIRGSAEWKEWLERFAARMRVKPTAIIDLALAKLAEQERFTEPPPRM